MPGIDFYSIQKGNTAQQELKALKGSSIENFEIIDHTDELNDFSDTAAYIYNLDLVIAVDTSVAHMAGALGKPIWILNRFDSDWRWLINKSRSPWYQTALIFNQATLGDWDGLLVKVREELARLVIESNIKVV
jgi:ADP-heptose:LPS heptosyltransferase